eukprot:6345404-Prymnesium_polylepis.1
MSLLVDRAVAAAGTPASVLRASRFERFGGGVRGRRSVADFLTAPDRRLRPASRSIWVSARAIVLIVPTS